MVEEARKVVKEVDSKGVGRDEWELIEARDGQSERGLQDRPRLKIGKRFEKMGMEKRMGLALLTRQTKRTKRITSLTSPAFRHASMPSILLK